MNIVILYDFNKMMFNFSVRLKLLLQWELLIKYIHCQKLILLFIR